MYTDIWKKFMFFISKGLGMEELQPNNKAENDTCLL